MKFQLKELAKIEEASIEVKDLTVFVGKNSTNKSYMAHTVYMLNKVLSSIHNKKEKYATEAFGKYIKINKNSNFLKEINRLKTSDFWEEHPLLVDGKEYDTISIRKVVFDFSGENIDIFIESMLYFIVDNIVEIVNKSFNTEKSILKNIILNYEIKNSKDIHLDKTIIIESNDRESDDLKALHKIFGNILEALFDEKAREKAFYFPASRTGFVLAFDEIVSGVLRDRFGGLPTTTKLTEPTIDFISDFADIKSNKFRDGDKSSFHYHNYAKFYLEKIFNFIENRIVKGKIIEDKNSQNYTQFYMQTNNAEKLDLHLTSSSTVELLPLVIFLKHFSTLKDKLLIIEEPEAHLHPKAQVEMARLLVMLVNSGAKVLITTHSDYILNELSNCIKLSSTSDEKRAEYLKAHNLPKETVIDKERVSAYLFKDLGESTEVMELAIDEYGIANDNFDDILDELLDRTEEINELIGL